MDIAVVGACGDVGRQIVQQVVMERLLGPSDRLVLGANAGGPSALSVYGLATDLVDAYAEISPRIEVCLQPEDLRADLIIIAAGATPVASFDGSAAMTRDRLADRNAPLFHLYARALAAHGTGHEIVVCVSNPNELAVAIFATHLDRSRVIGMGSFLDSLRFRHEIASDLGVRRQEVHGFVVGEHGTGTVPLWSSVHVYGYAPTDLESRLEEMQGGRPLASFPETVEAAQRETSELIAKGAVQSAYEAVDAYPPDVRVVVRPFVTHYSGAKTVIGTARATMEFLRTIALGNDAVVSGQAWVDGEVYGIRGPIGVPFIVGNRGIERVLEWPMTAVERDLLIESARRVSAKAESYL
jgi:malate dehydrogenase